MFAGEYTHNLDAKNRVVLPKRLASSVSSKEGRKSWYLTLGVDRCLFLFTSAQFQKVESDLSPFLFGNKNARRFQRLFFSHVHRFELDGQSRMMVPDALKILAGIEKDVVFVGCGNRIEIWSAEVWKDFKDRNLNAFDELADVIVGGEKPPEESSPSK